MTKLNGVDFGYPDRPVCNRQDGRVFNLLSSEEVMYYECLKVALWLGHDFTQGLSYASLR